MKRNSGEAITITVIALALLSGVIGLWFGGTKYAKVVGLNNTSEQKTRQVMTSTVESKPIIVTGQDGKQYILQSTKQVTSTLDTAEEQPMTIWQRIMMLPKIALLLSVLGVAFPPFGLWLISMVVRLRGNLKQIVVGVEEAKKTMTAEDAQKLLTSISMKSDQSTKTLVKKIKVKL